MFKLFGKKKTETPQKEKVTVDERLQHIAFIMDGNGRWAQKRGMPREFGHSHGAATFRKIGRYCEQIGIKIMTIYAFSTENWKRPQKEVDTIMGIFDEYIEDCFREMADDNVHTRFIGDLSVFPQELQEKMARIDRETVHKPFTLNVAINYGGREEIVHACRQLLKEGKADITEQDISNHIYTSGFPDPDLVVRTGGDFRVSNFLLWQSAYSEFYFTDVLWPDLTPDDVDEAVRNFYGRKRRYGGIV